jgi:hypothetical protein
MLPLVTVILGALVSRQRPVRIGHAVETPLCKQPYRIGPVHKHRLLSRPHTALIRCSERPLDKDSEAKKPGSQLMGRLFGFAYLGNFITVVTIGVLKRLDLIELPPINTLTAIANNALDAEIAAGRLQPLLATGWSLGFWLDLLRQYVSIAPDKATFVADYCVQHASLCSGI